MSKKMKAAILDGFHQDFHWEDDVEIADPRANEIQVKIVSCGLCHTERAEQVNLWGLGLLLQRPAVGVRTCG